MSKKFKFMMCIFVILAVVITAFTGCDVKDDAAKVTEGGSETLNSSEGQKEEKAYDIDYDVVNAGDVSVISDYSGIRILNEVSGEENIIFEKPATSMAFNGEILYFFVEGYADESIEAYRKDYDTGEYVASDELWERSKLYSYSALTKEITEILDANSSRTKLIYIDDSNIYFADLKEDYVGNFHMLYSYTLDNFVRFNLKSGDFWTVLEDIGEIEYVDGNFIYQSERYMNGDRGFHPTHIYNIESGKSYDIDECASFAYADDEKIYYLTQEETEYSFNYNLESCSFTGTDKKLVSELDFLAAESDYRIYAEGETVNFDDWGAANADFIFNIATGEAEEYDFDAEEDESKTIVKETANGYYIEKYDTETAISSITFHKGEANK